MMRIALSSPWETFKKMVWALFEKDPDIIVNDLVEAGEGVGYDYVLNIEVANHEKFVALDRVVPEYKIFGNVILRIVLFDAENNGINPGFELYQTIFKDNPIFEGVSNVVDMTGTSHGYVKFKPEVVQFFDDNLADYNGNWSGLAEDIARELFENDSTGIYFCTASKYTIPCESKPNKKKK